MFLVSPERLKLKEAKEYNYLNQSGCLAIHDVVDAHKFESLKVFCTNRNAPYGLYLYVSLHVYLANPCRTFVAYQEAFNTLRIHKESQEQIFEMLAAVLWLGNISFQVIDNENHIEVVDNEGKLH